LLRLSLVSSLGVLVLACGAGCGAPPQAAASSARFAIVGEEAPDEDAVLALKTGDGKLCTGTLVGPRVVATARHCLVNAETGAIDAAADVAVVPGAEPTADSPMLAVQSVHTFDDGPYGVGLQFILDVDGRDLAALVLEEEVSDITPRALFRGDPGDLVGAELTILGFGPNAPNAPETDFIRRTTPFSVEAFCWRAAKHTCARATPAVLR
jgi:protease YdgD